VNFALTADQEELRGRVASFVRDRLNPLLRREEGLSREIWRACGEFGLLGLSVPEEHGGLGRDALSTAIALEAFGYACDDMGLAFSVAAHLLSVSMAVVEQGTDEQRRRYLPLLCSGEWIAGNAMTEASAGSDAFAISTSARRVDEVFVVSGEKSYVTNGTVADLFLVYARTRKGTGPLGISALLVERGSGGVRVGAAYRKMGLTRSPLCALYLEDCRIPVTHLLGREDRGASVFTRSMAWERACLFAAYLGRGQRLLEATVEHVRDRKQFGKSLSRNQAVSHRIVDMKLRLESARLLLYRACWRLSNGDASDADIALSKLAVSEAAVQSSLDAIQLFGGAGYLDETGIAAYLRDAVPATIFSGTSEIQRELVASALGLYRG
jgi:alkylation response protein AidB-like acyl-CoA dehydrogenase